MGCFKKLYDKNYVEPKPEIEFNGWTNCWSDIHDYYNEIDARLNARFNDNSNITTNSSSRPAQTVAGAARNGSATGRNTVRLSPTQVQIAKKLGVPLEEYAKQVQQIAAKNT